MNVQGRQKTRNRKDQKTLSPYRGSLLKAIYPLSSKQALERILDHENPRSLIRKLPLQDFFWLLKKVGDNDCLPLLEMASEDQWQYLLDFELWRKDRLHPERTSQWIERLGKAGMNKLVHWFFNKGQAIAYYYFFGSIHVIVKNEDEDDDIPDGFFSFDGVFYVKILDKNHKETIESILRTMASEDLDHYHAFLLNLSGVLSAELEEDMYRLRNVRMAEHGFLPFEEALSVYAPLGPEGLVPGEYAETVGKAPLDEDIFELAPMSPLYHARGQNLWTAASSRMTDRFFLDRIHLEFAGLCNKIFSADGVLDNDLDSLIKTCKKAAGYINLALEKLCGSDISSAEKILKNNPLQSVFRVGFGLALRLKWEAGRWLKNSWFYGQGLDFSFWGDDRGEILAGIVKDKPRLYVGFEEGEAYRDFEKLSEIEHCSRVLKQTVVLDSLLERLSSFYPVNETINRDLKLSFYPLLFNFFARKLLKLEPGYSGISPRKAKAFFSYLRSGNKKPPYQMPGFEDMFIGHMMEFASDLESGSLRTLKETLSRIWQEFDEEYRWVSLEDLDEKSQRFLLIMPHPQSPAG